MKLTSVYDAPDAMRVLYDLLKEREPHQNISHKEMPTWHDHMRFVASHPYEAWYLIEDDRMFAGAIYLTRQREVGIFIFKAHAGRGHGHEALRLLSEKHPGPLLANVSVFNSASMAFFMKEGFEGIQITFRKEGNAKP